MLALHVVICVISLLAGAVVLAALCNGRHQPAWVAAVLLGTALISLTGFLLPSPPGTPTPDPARVVGVLELLVVAVAALALYGKRLARIWGGLYDVTIVLAIYLNFFVATAQAFAKIGFLHALAPTGKEPPFLIAQLLVLALFAAIGVVAFKRFPVRKPQI